MFRRLFHDVLNHVRILLGRRLVPFARSTGGTLYLWSRCSHWDNVRKGNMVYDAWSGQCTDSRDPLNEEYFIPLPVTDLSHGPIPAPVTMTA